MLPHLVYAFLQNSFDLNCYGGCNSEYIFLLGPLQTNILNFHVFDDHLDTVWVHSRGSYNKVASQKASALVCYQLLARYDAYTSSNQICLLIVFPLYDIF